MIYLSGEADGKPIKIIVLETKNLEELAKGNPCKSPDDSVLICWTPDPVWLADKLANTNGDGLAIARIIDEAAKRPQKPTDRPYHKLHTQHLGGQS